MPTREIPDTISGLLKSWWLCFLIWSAIHYLLGLTATIGTVFIAAKTGAGNALAASSQLGIIVAICTAIITFSNASAKANAYIQAWRVVHTTVVRYQIDATITEVDLGKSVERAEEIIGKSDT